MKISENIKNSPKNLKNVSSKNLGKNQELPAFEFNICSWINLGLSYKPLISGVFSVMAIISVISYTTPIFLVPVSIIMIFYCFVQQVYVSTSRQLKRLESVLKSPIYSHFGETLNGTTTIKAFKMENDFIKQSEDLVDQHHKVNIWILLRSLTFKSRKCPKLIHNPNGKTDFPQIIVSYTTQISS